jgi:hypothetical protein
MGLIALALGVPLLCAGWLQHRGRQVPDSLRFFTLMDAWLPEPSWYRAGMRALVGGVFVLAGAYLVVAGFAAL